MELDISIPCVAIAGVQGKVTVTPNAYLQPQKFHDVLHTRVLHAPGAWRTGIFRLYFLASRLFSICSSGSVCIPNIRLLSCKLSLRCECRFRDQLMSRSNVD